MNLTDAAWLAGLYEGEGCLTRSRDWNLVIAMTDEDVVRRVHALTGVGGISVQVRPNWKPSYRWVVCRRDDIEVVVQAIRPWLGERRGTRVDEFLAWKVTAGEGRGTREVCRKGHPKRRIKHGWYCPECRAQQRAA